MKLIYIILIAVAVSTISNAQVSLTGEIRPRAEIRDGYSSMRNDNSEMAFAISQRSRLNLGYKDEKYEFELSLQDIRVWGEEKNGADKASVALHQAWIRYKLFSNIDAKIGRQSISFENKSILSGANWSQASKKHDALRLTYHKNDWQIDLINAFNQASVVNSGTDYIYSEEANGNYKNLNVLWINNKVGNFDWHIMSMAEGFQYAEDTVRTRFTYGAVLKYNLSDIKLVGRYFGQGGELVNGTDISSFHWNFEAYYKLNKSNFCLGIDQYSGNNYKDTDGKSHLFESPYGSKHYINGVMDYFKKSSATKNSGLTDIYLKCELPVGKLSTLNAHYHCFTTAEIWYNSTSSAEVDKYLASELDMYIKTKIEKSIKLEYGMAFLKGSDTLAAMKSGDPSKINQWYYLMVTVTPKFL